MKLLHEIFRKLDISYRIWRYSSKNIFHRIFQNFKKTLRVSKTTKSVLHPLGMSSKLLEDSSYLNWKCHATYLLLQVTYLAPHVYPYWLNKCEFHKCSCTILHSLLWSCMTMYWPVCPSMVLDGHLWSFTVLFGLVWTCVILYGPAWSFMILYGHEWYYTILYGIAWYCMVMLGSVWPCTVLYMTLYGLIQPRSYTFL